MNKHFKKKNVDIVKKAGNLREQNKSIQYGQQTAEYL